MIEITGDEIYLKTYVREEYHEFYKKYVSDPIMDPDKYIYNMEQVDKSFDNIKAKEDLYPRLGIFLNDNTIIGELSIKRIDYEKSKCEFGIVIVNDRYKGLGYGSEAFKLAIDYVFNTIKLKYIYADTMGSNIKMQKILDKFGFRYIEKIDNCYDMCDRLEDKLIYVLEREDNIMSRKIGVSIPFWNKERSEKIEKAASENGFITEFFENEKITKEKLDDCEVFFGMISPKLIEGAKKLKWMHASFAGVDKYVNIKKIQNGDIKLTNSSGAYGITISEHMITVLLMLMRRMPEYYTMQIERGWNMVGDIKSIMNSTITIVGMGDIGQNFAKRVKAMGATVRGVRKNASVKPDFVDEIYSSDRLLQAIEGADVVALCLPETNQTKMIIGKNELDKMKEDAILINVGRGTAIDQDALVKSLNYGQLGGAALDVTVPEPLTPDNHLWTAKNLIITPHISGNTSLPLTCDIIVDLFCENLKRYAKGEKLNHLVDCRKGY